MRPVDNYSSNGQLSRECFVVIRVWAFWPSCHHGYHRFNLTFLFTTTHRRSLSLPLSLRMCTQIGIIRIGLIQPLNATKFHHLFVFFPERNFISFILRHAHTHIDSNRFVFELILLPLFVVTNFYDQFVLLSLLLLLLLPSDALDTNSRQISFSFDTYHWNQRKIKYRLDFSLSLARCVVQLFAIISSFFIHHRPEHIFNGNSPQIDAITLGKWGTRKSN